MLPSGLSEQVEDDESLARFLTSSNHFSTPCDIAISLERLAVPQGDRMTS
jgi:hypothetical protein